MGCGVGPLTRNLTRAEPPGSAVRLFDFRPVRSHTRLQKSLRQIALTCKSESPETLVPFARGHNRFGGQPVMQFVEIGD